MKILAFPKDRNPYQELLYSELRKIEGIEVEYYESKFFDKHAFSLGIPAMPFRLLNYRLRGFKIFHLHWFYAFLIPVNKNLSYYLSAIYFYFYFFTLKALGFKIVWTAHNIKPHNREFINDSQIYQFISKNVDLIICHNQSTIEDMKSLGMNTSKCSIVAIGNYISVYKNIVTREKARQKFNFKDSDIVITFFGRVMKYKGIEDLLEVFTSLNDRNLKLIIAGKSNDKELSDLINKNKSNPNILIHNEFIKDDDVQDYFNASDILVFPFKAITTSSTIITAFGFGKTVVAPKIGAIKDLPDNIGFFYDSTKKDGFKNELLKAINNPRDLQQKNNFAFDFVKKLSWNKIAEQTHSLFNKL